MVEIYFSVIRKELKVTQSVLIISVFYYPHHSPLWIIR